MSNVAVCVCAHRRRLCLHACVRLLAPVCACLVRTAIGDVFLNALVFVASVRACDVLFVVACPSVARRVRSPAKKRGSSSSDKAKPRKTAKVEAAVAGAVGRGESAE